MNQQPLISIIIPCYNCENSIAETIASVRKQSYQNYELIFVDDASNDGTLAVLKRQTKNLCAKIISQSQNSGPGGARNKGISLVQGNYVCFLDADDIWKSDKLETQLKYHLNTKCAISCTGYKFGNSSITNGATDYKSLLKNNIVNTSSIMFDRRKIRIEFTNREKAEDYLLWLTISKHANIHFIRHSLVIRKNFDGISSNKLEMARKRWNTYRKYEKLNLMQSTYYFLHYFVSGLTKYLRA